MVSQVTQTRTFTVAQEQRMISGALFCSCQIRAAEIRDWHPDWWCVPCCGPFSFSASLLTLWGWDLSLSSSPLQSALLWNGWTDVRGSLALWLFDMLGQYLARQWDKCRSVPCSDVTRFPEHLAATWEDLHGPRGSTWKGFESSTTQCSQTRSQQSPVTAPFLQIEVLTHLHLTFHANSLPTRKGGWIKHPSFFEIFPGGLLQIFKWLGFVFYVQANLYHT